MPVKLGEWGMTAERGGQGKTVLHDNIGTLRGSRSQHDLLAMDWEGGRDLGRRAGHTSKREKRVSISKNVGESLKKSSLSLGVVGVATKELWGGTYA